MFSSANRRSKTYTIEVHSGNIFGQYTDIGRVIFLVHLHETTLWQLTDPKNILRKEALAWYSLLISAEILLRDQSSTVHSFVCWFASMVHCKINIDEPSHYWSTIMVLAISVIFVTYLRWKSYTISFTLLTTPFPFPRAPMYVLEDTFRLMQRDILRNGCVVWLY